MLVNWTAAEQFGDAEVGQLHVVVGRDQDVRGLDIAMDDAVVVSQF
ncbi:MAG: hypothetical protein QM811_20855 [Pirellulales bacterium]